MKSQHKRTILVLDDDETNLEILAKTVHDSGYDIIAFESGAAALNFLRENPSNVDIALLDKMMPDMGGVDILKYMKSDDSLKHIPVVIQTGDVGVAQMCDGIENGAYYYLTKPFHPEVMIAILHSAVKECAMREELLEQIGIHQAKITSFMQEGEFVIRTLTEAKMLATMLSQMAENPSSTLVGLMELMSNAIEHGSSRMEKKRNAREDHEQRTVRVRVSRTDSGLHVVIIDQGDGFDWRSYTRSDHSGDRINQTAGRGIVRACSLLDDVMYVGSGNEVHCTITSNFYPLVVQQDEIAANAAYRNA